MIFGEVAGGCQMRKCDLIDALAEKKNISCKKSEEIINSIFDAISNAIIAGERVELRGFGIFTTKCYKPYVGRNPRTGDAICVKSKKLPLFKVGKKLKVMVNG